MKTSLFALALAAIFALTPQAQAGDKHKKKHKDSSHHRTSQSDRSHHGNSYRNQGNPHLSESYYGNYRRDHGNQGYNSQHGRDSDHRRSGPTIHFDF